MKHAGIFAFSVEISQREISGGMGDMAVSRERRNEIERKSKQKIYQQYAFKVRRDSGFIEAIEEALNATNIPTAIYIRQAVINQLIADGFLPKDFNKENEEP